MKESDTPKSISDIQIDEFLRELETPDGEKRIGEAAYKEAKKAEKRKSIHPNPNPK